MVKHIGFRTFTNRGTDDMVLNAPKPLFAPGTTTSTEGNPKLVNPTLERAKHPPAMLIEDDRPEYTGMANHRYAHTTTLVKQTLSQTAELNVAAPVVAQTQFNPEAGRMLQKYGNINPKTAQFLAVFETPTGILQLGETEMQAIAKHSDAQLNEVKDVDVSFVEQQLTQVIVLAKSVKLDNKKHQDGFSLHGLIDKVKANFIDIKEQMNAEFTDVSTKMDTIVGQVDTAVLRVKDKLDGFQQIYQDNIEAYQHLTNVLQVAEEAFAIKTQELEEAKANMSGTDLLEAENINRMQSALLRLDKKIVNLKKFQTMAIQTAPEITRQAEEAMIIIEKFVDIKNMTIPLWKRKIRQYIDSVELRRAANLEKTINDANNALLQQNSNQAKDNALAVANMNNRDAVDDETLELINKNLIETIVEVAEINQKGAIARKHSVERMEEMKKLYANIATGQVSIEELKSQKQLEVPKPQSPGWKKLPLSKI